MKHKVLNDICLLFMLYSFHLKQMLKETEIQEHCIQLSFDIAHYSQSFQSNQRLHWVHKKLQNDKLLKDRYALKKLIQRTLSVTFGHKHSTGKGKSIAGNITGIFMESYEEEFVLNPNSDEFIPAFWK